MWKKLKTLFKKPVQQFDRQFSCYQLGYADPMPPYQTLSGLDVKLFLCNDDGSYQHINDLQAISWQINEHICGGTMIFVVHKRCYYQFFQEYTYCDFLLYASNEYGHHSSALLKGVQFVGSTTGVSVDDLCIQENITFRAREIYPFDIKNNPLHSPAQTNAMLNKEI